MMHEGEKLDKEIRRLEHELEQPIDDKRRRDVSAAIRYLEAKKRSWERPH